MNTEALREIDSEIYRQNMRLRSIEAAVTRVEPFSEEFDTLMDAAEEIKKRQDMLQIERYRALREMYQSEG